jgi:hypothetical protein
VEAIKLVRQSLFRPFDFFYDIQFEKRAKLINAVSIMALACIARIVSLMLSGFAFRTREAIDVSIPIEILWVLIPWVTWSIANWSVSTIIDGEGKFKDILISSSYVYLPYIILIIPLLSNLLTLKEISIYGGVYSFMYGWMAVMLFLQVMIIHDFEFGKTVGIILLSLLAMLIMWLIIILVFGLVNQAIVFVINILKEIRYRS